jgi:hypothetical protein
MADKLGVEYQPDWSDRRRSERQSNSLEVEVNNERYAIARVSRTLKKTLILDLESRGGKAEIRAK